MNYDAMSVKELFWKIAGRDFNTVEEANILLSALRKAVIREASATWTRKYSLSNASGVSALYGKFPNGYRLDLENPNIPDGDYDLLPRKETP